MYKIKNGIAPVYVCNLMPPLVADRTSYNLRNVEDITVLNRRTELFSKSFIPSTTNYWNNLPLSIRNADSVNSFKSQLKASIFKVTTVPQYFITGNRVFSIYHCRIRNNCSNLNSDLFRNHLRPDTACECGFEIEDSEHSFSNATDLYNNVFVFFMLQENFIHSAYKFCYTVLITFLQPIMKNYFLTFIVISKKQIVLTSPIITILECFNYF